MNDPTTPTYNQESEKNDEKKTESHESLELGDCILIHAPRNANIDQQTYYVY